MQIHSKYFYNLLDNNSVYVIGIHKLLWYNYLVRVTSISLVRNKNFQTKLFWFIICYLKKKIYRTLLIKLLVSSEHVRWPWEQCLLSLLSPLLSTHHTCDIPVSFHYHFHLINQHIFSTSELLIGWFRVPLSIFKKPFWDWVLSEAVNLRSWRL